MKISRDNIIIGLFIILSVLSGYLVFGIYQLRGPDLSCSSEADRYFCWKEILNKTLEKQGLAASFEVLEKIYNTEPLFVAECHSYTHTLGENAYFKFIKNESVEMTPNASYCGYGFYHGFMETLLHTGGTVRQAQDFCANVDVQLSKFGPKTLIACFHGIGHGAVDGSDPRAWGSPEKLIRPGLDICKTISTLPDQIDLCGTGVFNALAIAVSENSFGLQYSDNPYEICLKQEMDFKKPCYEQMNTLVASRSGGDYYSAVKIIYSIPEEKYSVIAMGQLIPAMISRQVGQNKDFSPEIKFCNSIKKYLQQPCIEGLAGGILEFGKPNYEYVEAINLCSSSELEEAGREICFNYLVQNSKVLYSADRVIEICNIIPVKYRTSCST